MTKALEALFIFAKIVFVVALTVVLVALGRVMYLNPRFNDEIRKAEDAQKELVRQSEILHIQERNEKLQRWAYEYLSDVGTTEEKYPLVVLRTGYRVLRFDSSGALVGWQYELINTSPKQPYFPTVTFSLEDSEGFELATGTGETILQPESYGVVRGTIPVGGEDIGRLSGSSWKIKIEPAWSVFEAKTSGTRYSRLEAILKKDFPAFWLLEDIATKKQWGVIDQRWAAIGRGLEEWWTPAPSPNGAGAEAPASKTRDTVGTEHQEAKEAQTNSPR